MVFKLMKKEFYEYQKTGKLIAIIITFLLFSIISPITAKIMPEIVKSITSEVTIIVPQPTWKDAFLQFFKNMNQMVFLIVVLLFIGSIAEEKNRRTASLIVSKGVDRREWVLAKFIFQISLVSLLTLVSFCLCSYYSVMLFPDTEIQTGLQSCILFLIYMTFIISLTIFSSSLGNNTIQAGGIFISIFIILVLLNMLPSIKDYNPIYLSSLENQWITTGVNWNSATKVVAASLTLSILLISAGIILFNLQELE
jgi:ABC-2 type transport system permease protein